jgi:sulfate transport system substrate-binding protein
MGDALATFESEVPLIRSEFGDDFDVVYPGWTVLAENPVSVVDKVVDRRGTRAVAEAYLKWLWSDEGQTIAARHHLRPRSAKVLKAFAKDFRRSTPSRWPRCSAAGRRRRRPTSTMAASTTRSS